jgi:NAD(P)-dependent dehydrogenase (short-subunit alcohol dehydrogenase family)
MTSSQIFRDGLLDGQVAIVTGGGTGIGAAIARELTRLGATVVIASRKADVIERASVGLTKELGRTVHGAVCDIRDRDSVDALVKGTIDRHGRIDHVINNGGGQFFAPAETISAKGFDAVIATNLTGTWNLTRAAADGWLLKHGGVVTSITMLTRRAFPGMAHSHAARAGVEAMSRTLAVEWASRGVRVNCVAPGYVASSGITRYPQGLALIQQMQSVVPMKRLATCDEVAWMVAYLHTPAAAYVTGQTLVIDGGKELWGDYWPIPDPKPLPPIQIPAEPWDTE